tara:strand:- start:1251 stop:1604 length:354 start_codon:yes stop_codon:yes gene_type:complete
MELNIYTILQGSTLKDAVAKIKLNKVRTIIVLNEDKVIGVISEGDILKAFMNGAHTSNLLDKFINIEFNYLNERKLQEASKIIIKENINLLPIINQNMELIDVITIYDIFEEFLDIE